METLKKNHRILVNNLYVSYKDEGVKDAKETIVLIHGFPLNQTMWSNQLEVLKENYRVVTYDIRGHGDSEIGMDDFSMEIFANDLINLMDELRINKAILLGFSMGGYIAQFAAINFNNRFNKLILCNTNGKEDTEEGKKKRMAAIEKIKDKGVENFANENIENFHIPKSIDLYNEKIDLIKSMIVNTSIESLKRSLHALSKRKETLSSLNQIKIPVLIMVGEFDKLTPVSDSEELNENIKNAELYIIKDAGHISNFDNPKVFNEQLISFINKEYKDDENSDKSIVYKELEKDLNAKILKIITEMNNTSPELVKYIDEIPMNYTKKDVAIEITLNHLKLYYESLKELLNKYKNEQPLKM